MSNKATRLSDCPAARLAHCRGEAVPPAGDVEVLSYLYRHPTGEPWPRTYKVRQYDMTDWVETELVDRAHVTRLQAEVSALQHRLNIADQRVCDLQSELTKALFWLGHAKPLLQAGGFNLAADDIGNHLAHHSAPAAKVCSHIWVSADNRGAGAGEICQACSEHRPAAKLDASMIGIVHTPPMEYDEP